MTQFGYPVPALVRETGQSSQVPAVHMSNADSAALLKAAREMMMSLVNMVAFCAYVDGKK